MRAATFRLGQLQDSGGRIRMVKVMVEMPEILMPDQNAPGYPDEFKFLPLVESYYRGLPRALRGYWDAFGSGSVADMPLKPATRSVEGTVRARIRNYEAVAAQLERRFQYLQEMDRQMADLVRRSLSATRAGRERVEAAIQRINTDAGTVPVEKSKGDHILDYAETPVHREHRDTSTAHPTDSVAAPSAAPVPHTTTDMRRSNPQDPGPAPRNSLPGTVSDTTGQPDRDPSTVVGETTSAGPAAFTGGQSVAPSMPSATGSSTPWSSRTGAAPGSDQTGAAFLGKRIEARASGRQHASSIEDAPVVYVFPDGRTQEVSPVVAEVLDTAFGRRATMNARPASTGSSNAVSAGGPIGVQRETESVGTGDLAVWARGSAVVVVFGTGSNRSYEVIIDGHLQPLSIGMGEGPEEFGPFTGFSRLPGAGSDAGVVGPPVKDGQRPKSGSGERRQVDAAVTARTQRYRAPQTARNTGAVSAKKPADDKGAVVNG
ncbi:hypothetical protein ACIG56_21945 [Nocardia fusca]|uniref:hypothetical protein n=1 Tax=Nocardia fusca TaxID=941183 RepID=UPI0037C67729